MLGMFYRWVARDPSLRKKHLNLRIRWVTEGALVPDEQETRAQVVARELQSDDFGWIPLLLPEDFSPPQELASQFRGLCAWADARFDSIFLILRAAGEPAIPVLCQLAQGPYDWYQGMAVHVMCEMAAEGIQTELVARVVIHESKFWRYETLLRAINGMAKLASRHEGIAKTLLDLGREWAVADPIEELHILEALSQYAPEIARQRQEQLYRLMRETGRGFPRCPASEGFVVNGAGEISEPLDEDGGMTEDYHAIRAALAILPLHPDDPEVRSNLSQWAAHHSKRIVREQLAEVCKEWTFSRPLSTPGTPQDR